MSNLLRIKETTKETRSILKKPSESKKEGVYITEPKAMFDAYKTNSGQMTARTTKLPALAKNGSSNLVPTSNTKKNSARGSIFQKNSLKSDQSIPMILKEKQTSLVRTKTQATPGFPREKEKKKETQLLHQMLKETKKDIAEFIKGVYEEKDRQVIREYVQAAEALPQVRADIRNMKVGIQRKVNFLNDLTAQIATKARFLSDLERNLEVVQAQVKNIIAPDYTVFFRVQQRETQVQAQLLEEEYMTDILNSMIGRDRRDLDFLQHPMASLRRQHHEMDLALKQMWHLEQHYSQNGKIVKRKLELVQARQESQNLIMNNMVQAQLQEAEEKAIFNEIYKNQATLQDQIVKEGRDKKKKEAAQKRSKDKEREAEQMKKVLLIMDDIKNYQELMIDIKKKCDVTDLWEREKYAESLKQDLHALTVAKEYFQDQRDARIELKNKLKKELEEAQLGEKDESNSKEGQLHPNVKKHISVVSEKGVQVDEIKQEINRAKEVREDWLRRATRVGKVQASAMSIIAKLVVQCKDKKSNEQVNQGEVSAAVKSQDVVQKNVTKTLSIIGLRLEHMLVVMEKQKLTNPFILRNRKLIPPQQYMGIDYKIYTGPSEEEVTHQFQLEKGLFEVNSNQTSAAAMTLKQHKQQEIQSQIGGITNFYNTQGELAKLQSDEDNYWLTNQYQNVKEENRNAIEEALRKKREEQLEAQLKAAVERGEMPALQAKQKKQLVKTASLKPKRANTFFGKRNEDPFSRRKRSESRQRDDEKLRKMRRFQISPIVMRNKEVMGNKLPEEYYKRD